MIGSNALQSANGDRFVFHSAAATGRLTRAIANPAQNPGEHIRFAVDDIGARKVTLGNQPDVLGNIRVRGAGPLAIDYAMIVIRMLGIGWFHLKIILSTG
jgi:hypothetical protein